MPQLESAAAMNGTGASTDKSGAVSNGHLPDASQVGTSGANGDVGAAPAAPWAPADLVPLVIVGPSGVGKGTLIERLQAALPGRIGFSVSHTTRAPRPGELDGTHYHFVSIEEMKAAIAAESFVEHAEVHGNLYGTSRAAVEAVRGHGQICLLDIDIEGAKQIKAHGGLKAHFLFIAPPSHEELERRLRGRATETEDKIQTRLANAKQELLWLKQNVSFFEHVVVNQDVNLAAREVLAQVRRWYPSLVQQIKVTAQRSAAFYVRAARELVASTAASGASELEVLALGNAIPAAAEVCSALGADGHEMVQVETALAEVTPKGSERKVQTPRLSVIFRRAQAKP